MTGDESMVPEDGATAPVRKPPSPVERHIAYAGELIHQGIRPTMDLLVAKLGGSRTTAQKALSEFWAERLPRMLSAREYEDDVPVPVREAVGAIWRSAMVDAEDKANLAVANDRQHLVAKQVELDGALASIQAERVQTDRQLAEQAERITTLSVELATVTRKAAQAEASVSTLQMELSDMSRDLTAEQTLRAAAVDAADGLDLALAAEQQARIEDRSDLKDAMRRELSQSREAFAAERQVLASGHAQAMDALKTAYHDSEQRLRLELDAARTELSQSGKALDKARQEVHAAKTAAAEAQMQLQLRASSRWKRPLIKRPTSGKL